MSDVVTLSLQNRMSDLARLQGEAEDVLARHHVADETGYVVRLCLEELVSNVIRHAFQDEWLHEILVTLSIGDDAIELSIEDDGRPFDPNSKPEIEAAADSLEHAPTGGMGLSLVKRMAGPIHWERVGPLNRVMVRIARAV